MIRQRQLAEASAARSVSTADLQHPAMSRTIPPLLSVKTAASGLYAAIPAAMLLLLLLFLTVSCGSSTETIVVGGEARGPETAEEALAPDERASDLLVLNLGEADRILSMDPLFAQNSATKRTIQLAYEGLVRFDQDDRIVPAAARRWEVSADSLTWTFYLRRDLFFHDDESFAQGRGRRVNARDAVRIFERMASRNVPDHAANLFMNVIHGFEPFYLEQQEIFFGQDRQVTDISGLQAVDDSTVVFRLLEPEADFAALLASPYAVIYPSEPFRFRHDGLHRRAVGTGAFRHESTIGDSIHVFVRHENYYLTDDQGLRLPRPARVEVLNIADEMRLYDHFLRGRLHMIPAAGPRTVNRIFGSGTESGDAPHADTEGDRFVVRLPNPDPVILRYQSRNRSGLGRRDAASVIRHVTPERIAEVWVDPSLDITFREEEYGQINIGRVFRRFGVDSNQHLFIAFDQDMLPHMLGQVIAGSIDANLQHELIQRRVFASDIFLYLEYLQSMIPGTVPERQPEELLRIETDRFMIRNKNVDGTRTNSLSWWLDLRYVRGAGTGHPMEADRALQP